MAEETDDLSLERDLDDVARADLQKRSADELETILEAECDAVLARLSACAQADELNEAVLFSEWRAALCG